MDALEGSPLKLVVSIPRQTLTLWRNGAPEQNWPVSTARNGPGEVRDSGCTPRGWHRIRIKIGAGCPPGTVFVGRRPTGEIYTPALARRHPGRDWILTRILWLTGAQSGFNRGGDRDTLRRFIYIHGTPAEHDLGRPVSCGCIRMKNSDIIELFELVAPGTPVLIQAQETPCPTAL